MLWYNNSAFSISVPSLVHLQNHGWIAQAPTHTTRNTCLSLKNGWMSTNFCEIWYRTWHKMHCKHGQNENEYHCCFCSFKSYFQEHSSFPAVITWSPSLFRSATMLQFLLFLGRLTHPSSLLKPFLQIRWGVQRFTLFRGETGPGDFTLLVGWGWLQRHSALRYDTVACDSSCWGKWHVHADVQGG